MKKTIIRNALKVFAVGGTAAGMGAASIGCACVSAAIYYAIPAASGYAAVALFVLATLAAAGALAAVYMCGCWIVKTGKFAK